MKFLRPYFVLIVVLTAAVSSVEAGATTFKQPFLPAGIAELVYIELQFLI